MDGLKSDNGRFECRTCGKNLRIYIAANLTGSTNNTHSERERERYHSCTVGRERYLKHLFRMFINVRRSPSRNSTAILPHTDNPGDIAISSFCLE